MKTQIYIYLHISPPRCLYTHNKYEDINFEEEIDRLRSKIKELRESNNAKINVLKKVDIQEMEKLQLSRTIQVSWFSCYQCDKTFDLESRLKGHITRQHKEDNIQLRKKNKELNYVINILKKRLLYSEDKKFIFVTTSVASVTLSQKEWKKLKST